MEHNIEIDYALRETTRFILPTWIEGRKFEIPHCEKCGCIPYGGIGPDSRFCMKCGRRVVEVVND